MAPPGGRHAGGVGQADPAWFLNRELSLLAFHQRVVEQACDRRLPLLERLRFLCISCSNLDEFFEVRVAANRQRLLHGATAPGADGRTIEQTLQEIRRDAVSLVDRQYAVFNRELVPALAAAGVLVSSGHDHWRPAQRRWLQQYFHRQVTPILSPLGLDPVHPFPRILNKSLNFAVDVTGRDAFGRPLEMALVRAPRSLPRLIRLPARYARAEYEFVLLADLLHAFVDELFPGLEVEGCYQFRVTRNSELFVDEEEAGDLARALQGELKQRGFAAPVRLEIGSDCPAEVERLLCSQFGLDGDDVYRCAGPVNLNRLAAIHDQVDRPDLKYPPFRPRLVTPLRPGRDLFAALRRADHALHHPYDSFLPVVELLRQAAADPRVLAIKQTLYRTGIDSEIVNLLIDAARNGKDVTAVVELRARFDEEANIQLANRLQEAGVQVVYGIVGHKTHAKMILIVRREGRGLRRYVHLGTGNYHQGNTRAYTDWGLLTAHPGIAEDVHREFQMLSGLGKALELRYLLHSPFTLHAGLLARIEREIAHATAGREASIEAKMNGLTESELIVALYRAAQAGVKIRLVVRGICCLRPGVPGLSEGIEVVSIVGRFLEHSRVFYFHNDGAGELFIASADWMERNLFHRVETCVPILDPALAARIRCESLTLGFADRAQAWRLDGEGHYHRLDDDPASASQTRLTAGRTARDA